jgi:YbgC/YbaW family acyl-CoA thioester hydrolase
MTPSESPLSRASIQRRVRFVETDAAGIVHFSNYFRLMEEAEDAFWRSIDQVVHGGGESRDLAWPRVAASCDYDAPLRYDDEVRVTASLLQKRTKSLVFGFAFALIGPEGSAQPIARGQLTNVCVRIDPQTRQMSAVPIPAAIAQRIAVDTEAGQEPRP